MKCNSLLVICLLFSKDLIVKTQKADLRGPHANVENEVGGIESLERV